MAGYVEIGILLSGIIAVLGIALLLFKIGRISVGAEAPLADSIDALARDLEAKFTTATADMAQRLEQVKGDLKQETADRLNVGFGDFREAVDRQLAQGRQEQANALKVEIGSLNQETRTRLEAMRAEVDSKLFKIGEQVQAKLDQNIKEGFAQFEKVQQHLKSAEEELRNVGAITASIHDLNNLLKMPHLRGKFGEQSLERLLEDFLPPHMYGRQFPIGSGRADFVIRFPERVLPIDAKFPREQVLPLFDSSDPPALEAAREQFVRVMKEQARRISGYIQPENGTTDIALMYLPSETLYMEAVVNGELSEWLNAQRIFPVSPNTLIVTLQSIQMVFKMYEFAKGYEKATEELRKAQRSFGFFESKFEDIGRSLGKAQDAYETASRHLTRYRNRVTNLSGTAAPEVEDAADLHALSKTG